MNKDEKEKMLICESITSKIKSFDLNERKRAIALYNIFYKLQKLDSDTNEKYQDFLNNYDQFI